MGSRRRFSYRWRLFLPIIAMMWLLLIVMVFYHYTSEMQARRDSLREQVASINSRVLAAYENSMDLPAYLDFISSYTDNSLLDEVMVSVFDNTTGKTICAIGPSPEQVREMNMSDVPEEPKEIIEARKSGRAIAYRLIADKMFYVSANKSNDGRITVHTALPYTIALTDSLRNKPSFWIIIGVIAVAMTLMVNYTSKYMSKSVRLLRDYADNAENDNVAITKMPEFPHDELGDISRRIVQLYRDKADAIKRSEREHAVAIHAVEERARIKRQLTNNLNHELKTPIGVIRGYLDTILSTPDMDEATKDRFLARAYQNVERLCNMLDDVGTMTRLEESGGNLPVTDVDFHELVFNLERDLTASGICGDMKFDYDIPVNCHVKGNANLLTSMLNNLAKNAILHSHGTTMGLKLVVESKRFYTFSFYDDGIGVKDEELPRLFERFYRIDAGRSRKVGGTGLGLPIVKNTVEAHGGTMSVHNRTNGGLEFVFTLHKYSETAQTKKDTTATPGATDNA